MAAEIQPFTVVGVADLGDQQQDERFRERRVALGMSVAALARRAHVDRETLKRVEAGEDGVRETTLSAIDRALTELEQEVGMDDETVEPRVVRFVVRGVYGAEALVVEGPVESIAELEASVDRIMRRLRGSDGGEA